MGQLLVNQLQSQLLQITLAIGANTDSLKLMESRKRGCNSSFQNCQQFTLAIQQISDQLELDFVEQNRVTKLLHEAQVELVILKQDPNYVDDSIIQNPITPVVIDPSTLTTDLELVQYLTSIGGNTAKEAIQQYSNRSISLAQLKNIAVNLSSFTKEDIESLGNNEIITIEYHTLTPDREGEDLVGNIINKIRHYQKSTLTFDQAVELETSGYTVQEVNAVSFESFIAQFPKDPIAFFDNPETIINESQIIINDVPITLFSDGSTSDVNSGIFDEQTALNERKQRIIDEMNDQLSIQQNQILDPDLNFNTSNLTQEEIELIRNNQNLVEEFQKNNTNPQRTSFVQDLIAFLRRLLN